jgi:hypothetical protein
MKTKRTTKKPAEPPPARPAPTYDYSNLYNAWLTCSQAHPDAAAAEIKAAIIEHFHHDPDEIQTVYSAP